MWTVKIFVKIGLIALGFWALKGAGHVFVFALPLLCLITALALLFQLTIPKARLRSMALKLVVVLSVPLFVFCCFETALLGYSSLFLKQGGFKWWYSSKDVSQAELDSKNMDQASRSTGIENMSEEHRSQGEMYQAVGWDVPRSLWKRSVHVEGAEEAYYWMDVLHVHGERKIRRLGQIPAKKKGVERIMVLGDSFTYGQGVAAEDAYPAVLESMMNEGTSAVEVINLGVCGASSEGVLDNLKHFWERVQPDRVIYGVCMNDILPDDYWNIHPYDQAFAFPLPDALKVYLFKRTLSGKFLDRMYDQLLLKSGLRLDYRGNLNKNAAKYSARFLKDINEMAAFVSDRGGKPILGMVLNQYPMESDPLTERVEALIEASNIQLIPSDAYMKKHDGEDWTVHIAERHPNSRAHRVYAEMFLGALGVGPRI